jgi:hydrogenase-4 component E
MAETFLILIILTNLRLLTTSHLDSLITWVAVQGILLGFFALASRWAHLTTGVLVIGVVAILLKGFVFPKLLRKARKIIHARRELEPYIGYIASLFIGVAVLILSLWLGSHVHIPGKQVLPLIIPATIFSVFCGLFLIVSRKKALMQVAGFLIMENGAFMLGVGTLYYAPFLVEIGVLLDMLVAVFIMNIMINSLHRAFKHTDTHLLSRLKG